MWETAKEILQSQHPLSAVFYLATGIIFGAIVSVRYSIRAHRPKLIISGSGNGGNQHRQRWSVSITNRPSFFGQNLDGEPARELHALIRLNKPSSQPHMVYWDRDTRTPSATIEARQQKHLYLFYWNDSAPGYYIVDAEGEPAARFQGRRLGFVLWISDRLGRMTEFPFIVEFDDSHLKHAPRLTIVHPIGFGQRIRRLRRGVQQIRSAFRRT